MQRTNKSFPIKDNITLVRILAEVIHVLASILM